MPTITFYRQARRDGGIRTGIEIDQNTVLMRFDRGRKESDPALLWCVDVRCSGARLPREPETAPAGSSTMRKRLASFSCKWPTRCPSAPTRAIGRSSDRGPCLTRRASRLPFPRCAGSKPANWRTSCATWRAHGASGCRPSLPFRPPDASSCPAASAITNILIRYWGERVRGRRLRDVSADDARRWARELIKLQDTNAILTPIHIEYVCGKVGAREVQLARAFLAEFHAVDEGRILPKDWEDAKRIAHRVTRTGARRQLGDCLIRAISDRLHLEVLTADRRFPV